MTFLFAVPLAVAQVPATHGADRLEVPPVTLRAPTMPDASVAIVGGEPAASSDWPQVVALFDSDGEFACTGTLVADDLVLTAGHCGQDMTEVHVGSSDLINEPAEVFGIAEVWVHPNFYATYDVAIYQLDRASGVVPMPIVQDCQVTDYLADGVQGWIVGYGAIDTYAVERPTVLHEAQVPIVDADCDNLGRGCNAEVSPGGELLAGGDGIDSCSGDSGGPLFLDTPEGWLLAGVTSRAAVPVRVPCGDGGIYARADAVAAWIESETGVTLPTADCQALNRSPVVPPSELVIGAIRYGYVDIVVDDPNADQSHTMSVRTPPAHGIAWLEGQRLHYQPDAGWSGDDVVEVAAVDDGDPPAEGVGIVNVSVRRAEIVEEDDPDERGCAHTAPTGWWWLVALLHPARARSRSSSMRRTRMGSRRP